MMKNKSLGISVLGVLTLLTLLSFASAALTFSSVPALSKGVGTHSASITITSNQNETVTFTGLANIVDEDGKIIHFTLPSPINTVVGISQTVTVSYTVPEGFKFTDTDSATLTANGSSAVPGPNSPAISQALSFEFALLEEYSDNGNLNLDDVDVSVIKGFGDDTEWYPLDEIRVNIDVSNDANDEIRNIVVKWGLYDRQNSKWVIDGEETDFDLDEDDSKTVEFSFVLDKINKLEDNGDYVFYVWATGDDRETDNKTSTFSSLDIDVMVDSHLVVLDSLEIIGTVSCGNEVQISGKVWNIGDSDEENVYLKVYNTELGISQRVEVGDIDSFDSKDLSFNLVIPEDAEEGKSYDITFLVYDDSNDIFENENGDTSQSIVTLNIAPGSCSTEVPVAVIANLESEAKAGQELVVKATITNTASTQKTFVLEVGNHALWSSLVSIDKTSITLGAGQSQDVLIKLRVNNDVSGDQSFNIVMKEGTRTTTQPVSVSVAGKGFSLTGWIAGLGLGGNAYLWAIGALNVLLVLIIIVVAVRVVRKK